MVVPRRREDEHPAFGFFLLNLVVSETLMLTRDHVEELELLLPPLYAKFHGLVAGYKRNHIGDKFVSVKYLEWKYPASEFVI
jgi:hypothetical protein